jgi:hypothetical protein
VSKLIDRSYNSLKACGDSGCHYTVRFVIIFFNFDISVDCCD